MVASLGIIALGLPAGAWAQTTTGSGSTTSGTTTGAGTAPAAKAVKPVTGPPAVSRLRVRKIITAEQGHARFMVGVTQKTQGMVVVTIRDAKTRKVVRTATSPPNHLQGPTWLLVQGVNDQGYQLPAGPYILSVIEKNSRGTSKSLTARVALRLTPPRGRLDCYTVPNLPAIARQMKLTPGGQLVTACGAKGALVNAGLRRGDVITKINGLDATTPGQWQSDIKSLPADKPFPIEYRRGTVVTTAQVQVPPDWTPAPDYAPVFKVALKREGKNPMLGDLVGSVRSRIDAGKLPEAQTLFDAWPANLKATGIGQMVQGEILLAKNNLKGALKAYEAATAKDPLLAPALLGKGLVLSRLNRTGQAVPVFQAAVAQDPGDAVGQAFLAYALIATNQNEAAMAAATTAANLDLKYEDGPIALGLAQIALGQKATGVANLKKGLLLMSDQQRADTIIRENLEPNA
jgi:hypothetical protein